MANYVFGSKQNNCHFKEPDSRPAKETIDLVLLACVFLINISPAGVILDFFKRVQREGLVWCFHFPWGSQKVMALTVGACEGALEDGSCLHCRHLIFCESLNVFKSIQIFRVCIGFC